MKRQTEIEELQKAFDMLIEENNKLRSALEIEKAWNKKQKIKEVKELLPLARKEVHLLEKKPIKHSPQTKPKLKEGGKT